jgi:hypothetical protein
MKVTITKAFRWAREGIYVVDLRVGDVVEGRPADIALAEGWGREVRGPAPASIEDAPPPAAPPEQPPAQPEPRGEPQRAAMPPPPPPKPWKRRR